MVGINVEEWGSGTPVVLVHGSLATGPMEWEAQRWVADDRYRLLVPTRRAYVGADQGEDFVIDGSDVAQLLDRPAHLVGHSYGALGAIMAAVERPDSVRSLVLAEPPLFDVANEHPAVARMRSELELLLGEEIGDREFLTRFLRAVGTPVEELDADLLDELATMTLPLRRARQPWEAPVPLAWLASAPFPTVVVSGDHHPAFSAICEATSRTAGARLTVAAGAGHEVQWAERFNEVLLATWSEADSIPPGK